MLEKVYYYMNIMLFILLFYKKLKRPVSHSSPNTLFSVYGGTSSHAFGLRMPQFFSTTWLLAPSQRPSVLVLAIIGPGVNLVSPIISLVNRTSTCRWGWMLVTQQPMSCVISRSLFLEVCLHYSFQLTWRHLISSQCVGEEKDHHGWVTPSLALWSPHSFRWMPTCTGPNTVIFYESCNL